MAIILKNIKDNSKSSEYTVDTGGVFVVSVAGVFGTGIVRIESRDSESSFSEDAYCKIYEISEHTDSDAVRIILVEHMIIRVVIYGISIEDTNLSVYVSGDIK